MRSANLLPQQRTRVLVFWNRSENCLHYTQWLNTLSKFLSIKFVSEMAPTRRAIAIISLILVAELALILFAITPAPWNIVPALFKRITAWDDLWVGAWFLEGRKTSKR